MIGAAFGCNARVDSKLLSGEVRCRFGVGPSPARVSLSTTSAGLHALPGSAQLSGIFVNSSARTDEQVPSDGHPRQRMILAVVTVVVFTSNLDASIVVIRLPRTVSGIHPHRDDRFVGAQRLHHRQHRLAAAGRAMFRRGRKNLHIYYGIPAALGREHRWRVGPRRHLLSWAAAGAIRPRAPRRGPLPPTPASGCSRPLS